MAEGMGFAQTGGRPAEPMTPLDTILCLQD
jgi:hypothetical protein